MNHSFNAWVQPSGNHWIIDLRTQKGGKGERISPLLLEICPD